MLKKNVINYLQGDFIAKIMSFAALIAIGAWASKEDIGIFTILIFAAEMMAIFISFGADSAIVKFYRSHTPIEVFNNYIFQNAINVCIAAAGLYVIGIFLGDGAYRFILENYGIILCLAISLSINTIARAHLISLHESRKVKWFSILSSAMSLSSILFFSNFFGLTLISLAASRIIGVLIFVIFFTFLLAKLFNVKKINLNLAKKMYEFSTPILMSTIIGTISAYMSRIVLAKYVSEYELGIFSFFIMIMISTSMLLHSFNQAWFPYLFDLNKSGNERQVILEINKKMITMLKIGFCWVFISTIVFMFSNRIYFNMNGYYHYRYIIFILMDSMIFGGLYIIINPLLYIKSRTKHVAFASLIILISNFLVTIIFVNTFGIFGAAIAAVLVTLISFYLYWIFSQKHLEGKLINYKCANLIYILNIAMLIKYTYIYSVINLGSR